MGTTADKLAKLQETKSALKSAINGSGNTVGDKFSDYPIAVTNGKSLIAAAVTDKGVETAADATFQQMANNIVAIEGVEKYTITFTNLKYGGSSGGGGSGGGGSGGGSSSVPLAIQYYDAETSSIAKLSLSNMTPTVSVTINKGSLLAVFQPTSNYMAIDGEFERSSFQSPYTTVDYNVILPKGDLSIDIS